MIEALPFTFAIIAFFYSMGGFAGGSSYLLALTAAGVPFSQMQATALFCNLAVSAVTFARFRQAGYFRARLVMPFTVASVPAAYLGAQVHLPKEIFIGLLSASLFAASLRIFFSRIDVTASPPRSLGRLYTVGLPVGGLLGFLSGVVGVGGGVYLCPALILLRWASVKEASAAASFFILVNSLSGLWGQGQKAFTFHPDLVTLALAALVGGFVGSSLGVKKFSPVFLQRVLATLLGAVSLQLLSKIL